MTVPVQDFGDRRFANAQGVIGLDIHRTFSEVVFLEKGELIHGGRVELTHEKFSTFFAERRAARCFRLRSGHKHDPLGLGQDLDNQRARETSERKVSSTGKSLEKL